MNDQNIVLFSGGIDSYIGLLYAYKALSDTCLPMYIHYKGDACNREAEVVLDLAYQTEIVEDVFNLKDNQSHDKHSTLFGRNLYFCTYAAQYTKKYIYLCGLKNSEMLDNTPDFYDTASEVLTQISDRPIIVTTPFLHMEKEDIVEWYLNNGFQLSELLKTTSCYHPKEHYCGRCLNCFYLYCSLYRHTDALEFTNKYIIHDELCEAAKGNRERRRTESINDIAYKAGILL